ncbi:aldo/keto reductase, partial [Candidatus Woesearchaeota archaeon]|nr:aldo/keto reductase [Candidatus Woesearchaeota archaeon]
APKDELIRHCKKKGIVFTSYSPMIRGRAADDSTLQAVGKRYCKSACQVSLRWNLQRGTVVIPKSSSEEHLREDMDIFDWKLSDKDMKKIHDIDKRKKIVDTEYT